MGRKGLNWVKALPEYQNILNEDPKEVLQYKSPFEIYFARKPCNDQNRNLQSDLISDELAATIANCKPTDVEPTGIVVSDMQKMSGKLPMLRLKVAIEEWLTPT